MNALLRWLFRRMGWSVKGSLPQIPKYVVAVAPHTSSWDFVIGMMARAELRMYFVRFLGKKELFDGPFGWFFRALGGTPVDRSSSRDVVAQTVEKFQQSSSFVLALAPEGTRKKTGKLKTGFYYMALGAGVPILPIGLDFGRKQIAIAEPFWPTGDVEKDLAELIAFFRTIKGKNPDQGL